MNDWHLDAARSLALGRTTVGVDRLTRPDGERTRAAWVDSPDTAAVVALAGGGERVVLVEEYRPRLGETLLSCPVGRVEAGESHAEAGARELREETGYRAGSVETLWTGYPTSWLRKRRGVVVATDCEPGDPDREADEFTDVRTVPREDALDAVRGRPAGEWTLTALLLAAADGRL